VSRQDGQEVMAKGLYANIHAKRKRIAAGSGEKIAKLVQKVRQQLKRLKQRLKQLRKK
jgi:signal recognition particle GTPase